MFLSEHLKAHLPADPAKAFDAIMQLQGEVFREHKNRSTFRAIIGGRAYFVKIHGQTAWGEIMKNALRGRWPVLTAAPEWHAIGRLEKLGVPTVNGVGYGCRGRFPHRRQSFIITEALEGMIHLDELPQALDRLRVGASERAAMYRRIVNELARISRLLHSNGLNHRDYYLNHFMIRDRDWSQWRVGDDLILHVIDLHRMQIRARGTPRRWMIKDISGLLFSAFDAGPTRHDCLRFLRRYWGDGWRERWRNSGLWRRQVLSRAVSLYRSERGRSPRLPAGLASSS
jgi:heptose I phosphotransferase